MANAQLAPAPPRAGGATPIRRSIRPGAPAGSADVERLQALLRRAPGEPSRWLALVAGRSDDVEFLLATADPATLVSRSARPPHDRRARAVLVLPGGDAAACLVDTAVGATGVELALLHVEGGAVEATVEHLRAGDVDAAAEGADIVVTREAPVPRRRLRVGRRQAVALAAAAALVVGASLGILWAVRRGPGAPSAVQLFPPVRSGAALAFDAKAGRPLLFGGDGAADQTWQWGGRWWNQLRPAISPPPRVHAAMAFDAAHGDVVLFGGRAPGGEPLDDTWAWRDSRWSPVRSGSMPPGDGSPLMAYDTAHGAVLLVTAACCDAGAPAQTWTFDGAAWTQMHPTRQPPRSAAVVSGGAGVVVAAPVLGRVGLWSWTGDDWQAIAVTGDAPPGTPVALAAEPVDRTLVLLAGTGGSRLQTWTFAGGAWTPHGEAAIPRAPQGVVVNPALAIVTAFAAAADASTWQAWAWTSTRWLPLGPTPPAVRTPAMPQFAAAGFDPLRGRFVVFGGSDSRDRILGTTLVWDGRTWSTTSAAAGPSPRLGAVMAWDPEGGRLLLYGGQSSRAAGQSLTDTWSWDGSMWTQVATTGGPGPDAYAVVMVSDTAHAQMLLLTATSSAGNGPRRVETWTLHGSAWTPAAGLQLPYPGPDAVVDDAAHHQVLAVASLMQLAARAETWRWDGHAWSQLEPRTDAQVMPVAVHLVADPRSASVVLLTSPFSVSADDPAPLGGVQVWDGSDWNRSAAALPDVSLSIWYPGPYWDASLQRVVALGGLGYGRIDQMWIWTEKAWVQVGATR